MMSAGVGSLGKGGDEVASEGRAAFIKDGSLACCSTTLRGVDLELLP